MTRRNVMVQKLFDGKYEAQVNCLYHQIMTWRINALDRSIRASVGLLAVATFAVSILGFPNSPSPISPEIGLLLAFASMAAAIILNVIPVSDSSQKYGELYRRWNSQLARWENLESRFTLEPESREEDVLREINELNTEKKNIQGSESAYWESLFRKCQETANMMYFDSENGNQGQVFAQDETTEKIIDLESEASR